MGQPITVTSRGGVNPEVVHFELNRSLTGMQIERYTAGAEVAGNRPPDELARRLFALGEVRGVTVYSSTVTVTAPAEQWAVLREKVEETIVNLFIYYREGEPGPALAAEPEQPEQSDQPGQPDQTPAEEPQPASS